MDFYSRDELINNKLQSLFNDLTISDLVLTINDHTTSIIIHVHKSILFINSMYFEKLLTTFKESLEKNICIEVPNARIIRDIIKTFYGITNGEPEIFKETIVKIKCYDFLGMAYDNILRNITVPPEEIDQLIDLIDQIGYTTDRIQLIYDNLPLDYDVSTFPKELIDQLGICDKKLKLITGGEDEINIWNLENGRLIRTMEPNETINTICTTRDNKYIITGGSDNIVKIWYLQTGTLLGKLANHAAKINSICISPDDKKIISGGHDCMIKVWRLEESESNHNKYGRIDAELVCQTSVAVVCSSNNKIISGTTDGIIYVWDAKTYEKIKTISINNGALYKIITLCITPDNKKFIVGCQNVNNLSCIIFVFDIETYNRIRYCSVNDTILSLFVSNDNKNIVVTNTSGVHIIDINTAHKIIDNKKYLSPNKSYVSSKQSYLSDNNDILITDDDVSRIKIWDFKNGELIRTIDDADILALCLTHNK